jgi:hypothetical protein
LVIQTLNVTKAEYDFIETVDLMFMRKLLDAPLGTPKEMLYLELGCLPFRDIIQRRRLSYLQYLLQEDPHSMVHRFLDTQVKKKNPKDWVSTVLKDLEELKMDVNFVMIKEMKKSTWNNMINKLITENSLRKLNLVKSKHTKVLHLEHVFMKMKSYLVANKKSKLTQTRHARGKFRSVWAKLNKTVYLSLTPIFELRCWQLRVLHFSPVLLMVLNLTS